MELLQLQYFRELARNGHLSRTAEALHIVQPSLSQTVKRLQSEVDVLLFDRVCNRIVLNDSGRDIKKICLEFLHLFPVVQRRDAVFLFKYILKIGLAGEAEICADLTQCFIRIGEKALRFFQTAPHDKITYVKPEFLFKFICQIGAAPADVFCHVSHLNRFIDMVGDKLDALEDFRGHSLGNLGLGYSLRKVY